MGLGRTIEEREEGAPQPLLRPDVWTWAALGALVLACALAASVVVWLGRGVVDEAHVAAPAGASMGA